MQTSVTMLIVAGAQAQSPSGNLNVHRDRPDGGVSFLTRAPGMSAIAVQRGQGQPTAEDIIEEYGSFFGVTDATTQLFLGPEWTDELGHTHTDFSQQHNGVKVFSGELRVHQDSELSFRSANGRFHPIDYALDTEPSLGLEDAVDIAAARLESGAPIVEHWELVIVDPGWYGDMSTGARLAFYLTLSDLTIPESDAFFIDAHTGAVLDQWDVLHTALDREVYTSSIGGAPSRIQPAAPVGGDVDVLYDYSADVYNYFFRGHARDGYDDAGATMISVALLPSSCPNAFWTGTGSFFCAGLAIDDVVGHEWGHAVTENSAALIYQNEPGQLNESFSDVFGELIDLFNGNAAFAGAPGGPPFWDTQPTGSGTDTPNNLRAACSPKPGYADGVRWLVGEDATAAAPIDGAIRDMWDPTCLGHPDRVSSPLQTCNPFDSGGVHSGSGIPNHAFAIVTDGKTFNSQVVSGIGPIKAAAVWYRALTVYLTTVSGFGDAAVALNQSASDLVGTLIPDPRPGGPPVLFTASDATQVGNAVTAVEMDLPGISCPLGACCNAIAGTCDDAVEEGDCNGVFTAGQLCSTLDPICTEPSDEARMVVVLDRTGSMTAIRSDTGNTRCADAITFAKQDVNDFVSGKPEREVDVQTFASTNQSITGGFVSGTSAVTALNGLGDSCSGATALADAICAAVASFPAGPVEDKVVTINTDGDENSSSGVCSGPASLVSPPPQGNYTAGSWQESVYNQLRGSVIAMVRNWTNFGGIDAEFDPETGLPIGPSAVSDNIFLQDFGGTTGGAFQVALDDEPLPDSFPFPQISPVPALGVFGVATLGVVMAVLGRARLNQRRMRRR